MAAIEAETQLTHGVTMGHAVHCLIVKFGFHSPQTLPTDLSRIRQNFPNIKTLHWQDDTWCNVLYAIKSLVFGLEIETFDISGVWFQDASELVQMIAMWPSMLWPNARTWAVQNLFCSMISSSMITIDLFIVGMCFPHEEEMLWVNGLSSKYGVWTKLH
ncbi:hypothetical protein EV361DRAFT_864634 [Lentinula raphanica]|nr:hypothetical protein EV361DRAFT_864634 [Lentinula raphanica]